mmetsp:Transcript_29948/g.26510  ORF Transcript_29948/g.26510 Transcript_29948/m.26510 type:complete len:106 (+) Transcript_29948:314-631(+)
MKVKKTVTVDLDVMYKRITEIHGDIICRLEDMIEKISVDVKRNVLATMGGRPVDVEEMKQFLKLKVDKVEFNQLNNIKVDKQDFQGVQNQFDQLKSQLKNLAIII